jgi:chromosome partitioning protein
MMHNLYPGMVFQTKIRRNTALSKASSAKKSIYDFDDKCAGAEDYMRLAKELLSSEK